MALASSVALALAFGAYVLLNATWFGGDGDLAWNAGRFSAIWLVAEAVFIAPVFWFCVFGSPLAAGLTLMGLLIYVCDLDNGAAAIAALVSVLIRVGSAAAVGLLFA